MLKKRVCLITLSTLLAFPICSNYSNTSFAEANENDIKVEINGAEQKYSQSPKINNDITLVPFRGIFESLGAEVRWDGNENKVIGYKDNTTLEIKIGSKQAFKNNKPLSLDLEPLIIEGTTLVPLRFISEAFGADVNWDKNTRVISINTYQLETASDNKNEVQDESSNILTFDDAVDKALKHSFSLKNGISEIEKAEELRKNYGSFLPYGVPISVGNGQAEAEFNKLYVGLLSADDNVKKARRDIDTIKENVIYQLKSNYNEVVQKEEDLSISKLSYDLAVKKMNIAKVQEQNGVISKSQLEQFENKVKELGKTKTAAENALLASQTKLNQLLGESSNSIFKLKDSPVFKEVGDIDLNSYTVGILQKHPAIIELENAKRLLEKSIDLYAFNSGVGETYQSKKIDLSKLSVSLEQTKENIAQLVKTTYVNIKGYEEQYQAIMAKLENAENDLKTTKLKFDVGSATSIELEEKALVVEQLKQQSNNLLILLDNMKMVLEKPWVGANTKSN